MTALAAGKGWMGRLFGAMLAVLMACTVLLAPCARAEETSQAQTGTQVLEAFDRQQVQRVNQASELSDHKKHLIMFMLAIPLIILLLITGGLGIATGVYGKQLFLAHMVTAGLTITLAVAHVIVGLVWFYPF